MANVESYAKHSGLRIGAVHCTAARGGGFDCVASAATGGQLECLIDPPQQWACFDPPPPRSRSIAVAPAVQAPGR